MPLSQMTQSQSLLPEFDQEMANTRKAIERAPEGRFDWKPHPRSNTLGWLVGFLAVIPAWTKTTLEDDSLDLMPGGKPLPPMHGPVKTTREVLDLFDRNVVEARRILAAASDETMAQDWALLMNGREVLRQPRAVVMRQSVLNHMIHHRGQLTVYLRLCDAPVPAIYGPSADEQSWG